MTTPNLLARDYKWAEGESLPRHCDEERHLQDDGTQAGKQNHEEQWPVAELRACLEIHAPVSPDQQCQSGIPSPGGLK